MKEHQPTNEPPRDDWPESARALRTLIRRIDTGQQIHGPTPGLSLEIKKVPGEYWVFQPGWFNLQWWWDEIKTSAELARTSLMKLQAFYAHERMLEQKYLNKPGFKPSKALSKHIAQVSRTRSGLDEEIATRLFSLREKIAWLIYEVSSSLFSIYLQPWRVSYTSVKREVEKVATGNEWSDLLAALKHTLANLDNEQVSSFFAFRHGYVHRIRPKAGSEQPLLLLQMERNSWDALEGGPIRTRRIVHLASYTWLRIIKCIQMLANLPLPAFGVEAHADITNTKPMDHVAGVHNGIGVKLDNGELIVSCMKECRGFKAWFTPDSDSLPPEPGSAEAVDYLKNIWEIIEKVIPFFEPERHGGVVKQITFHTPDNQQQHLFLVTQNEAADPITESLTQRAISRIKKEIDEGLEVFWADPAEGLRLVEETSAWPEETRKAVIGAIDGTGTDRIPLTRQFPGSQKIIYHVVFRSPSKDDLDLPPMETEAKKREQFVLLDHSVTLG